MLLLVHATDASCVYLYACLKKGIGLDMSGETNLTICILIMPCRPQGRQGEATAKLAGMSFRCIQNYHRLIHPVEYGIQMRKQEAVFWLSFHFVMTDFILVSVRQGIVIIPTRTGNGGEFILSNLVISLHLHMEM